MSHANFGRVIRYIMKAADFIREIETQQIAS
jgi:hypothetical protein